MNDALPIGRLGGILVRLHYTWFLIAALITWSLAASYFPRAVAGYSTGAYWTAAVAGALLFFGSLLAHELAHSLMARRRGLEVVDITLFLFGGVAAIKSDTEEAADEFWITVVGPVMSYALAVVFGVLWLIARGAEPLLGAMLGYLAFINFLLATFNLLPGFPLDGGRLLRALIWWRTDDADKATRWAANTGVAIGYGLIAVGIFQAFAGFWVNGLWLVFIGWYLQTMAEQYRRQTTTRALFADIRVSDLTNTNPIVVEPQAPLDRIVNEIVFGGSIRAIPVIDVDGTRFLGLLTLNSISKVPREQWSATTAAGAMVPAAELHSCRPEDGIEEAIVKMQEHDVNQLPVLREDRFVGLLSRSTIIRHLEIRSALRERPDSGTASSAPAAGRPAQAD